MPTGNFWKTLKLPRLFTDFWAFITGLGQFQAHEYAPLEADLVLVDEASMIDLSLMHRLLRAMDSQLPYLPPVQKLVLLGDSRQLPPVNAGAPFIDLTVEANRIHEESAKRRDRLPTPLRPQGTFHEDDTSSGTGRSSVHLGGVSVRTRQIPRERASKRWQIFCETPKKKKPLILFLILPLRQKEPFVHQKS